MPRCVTITKSGGRCRRNALPGRDTCAIHSRLSTNPAPAEPPVENSSPTEGDMVAKFINKNRKLRVRYIGNASYWIAGIEFTTQNRVHEVPYEIAEYLLEEAPNLFEIED